MSPARPLDALDRPTWVHHVVLAALCVATVINYVQRNSIGPAESTIRADLHLTKEQTGAAIGAFFLVYALLQIPSGWLAQRWGGRLSLTLFAAGCSVALALCGLAPALPTLVAGRALMGALQAGIFPCCTLILAAWYPASRRGFATAMLTSCMYVGGAVSTDLTGRLLAPLGWRGVFLTFALPGLAWAAWFAVWFRNRPAQHPSVNPAELALLPKPEAGPAKAAAPAAATPWLAIFLSPALVMICVQQFARSGALRFLDMWLPTYLQEARHETVAAAGALAKWPPLGAMVGVLLGGALSDAVLARTGSRRAGRNGVAIGCLLVGTACFVAAFFLPDARLAVLALSVGSMVSSSANPCVYALTMDMGGRNLGVVFATMNMAGNLGSAAFAWCAPLLEGLGGWDAPLAVFAGLHLFAAVCWLFINPNGTIGERPPAPAPE